jgi:hypothetical protein
MLLALFTACAAQVVAQEFAEPDFREIKQAITNTKSPNYYPKLLNRYLKNDSTLSLQQYRYLYYGFTLQEDFVPYQSATQALLGLRDEMVNSAGTDKQKSVCANAVQAAGNALADNPFDLLAIGTMAIAKLQNGDTTAYELWNAKQTSLLDVILSSGDGDAPESAFYVINIEHEYEIINRLGLVVESDSLCNDRVEYLRVRENADGERGFFFNFSPCRKVYKAKYE